MEAVVLAAFEVDERPVVSPHVLLEALAVAAARQPLRAPHEARARHAASGAYFDMIAAREAELSGPLFFI